VSASLLAAIAATAAAVISLLNVGLTAFFVGRQENKRWVREQLLNLVVEFNKAAHNYLRNAFETDWSVLTDEEQQNLGREEFLAANALAQTMLAFASPDTALAAETVMQTVQHVKFLSYDLVQAGKFEKWQPERGKAYWDCLEAIYRFTLAARSEMGLKPIAAPPGPARWTRAHGQPPTWRDLLQARLGAGPTGK
jgi:hypothetical protein